MGRSVQRFFRDLVILAVSAFVYAMAFPSFLVTDGIGFLAFFAWIPVLWTINRAKWRTVWFYGLFYGFVFYLILNYWLKTFHPLAILIAPVLESFQYVVLFLVLKWCHGVGEKRGYLLQALAYTSYEFITQQGFLGYPFGNMAGAIWNYTLLIQIASITGIWGIIMMMITPQAWIAQNGRSIFRYKWDITIYILLFAAQILFGGVSLFYYGVKDPERTVRIAAVQHSADSWKGGYDTYKENFEHLRDLSLASLSGHPDLVLWSETAFVPSVAWHEAHPTNMRTYALVQDFENFGKTLGVPLVTGNPEGLVKDAERPAVLPDGSWNWKTYNTVILFGDNRILGTYRKQHLVPFTEYFPYGKQFPWLYNLLVANNYKWWEKGNEPTVFSWNGLKFSTPICFEDTFGADCAAFVDNGADLLMNLTNDSWSHSICAEMQHMTLAVFRAVENRRPLVRGTNSGITCLVTPDGVVHDPMEPFTMGWHVYEVPVGQKEGKTFYTCHPDLFAYLAIIAFLVLIAWDSRAAAAESVRRRKLWKKYGHLFDHVYDEDWDT